MGKDMTTHKPEYEKHLPRIYFNEYFGRKPMRLHEREDESLFMMEPSKENNVEYISMAEHMAGIEAERKRSHGLVEALEFTVTAAEHLYGDEGCVPCGAPEMFYHTLSYDGDVELCRKTKAAREALAKYRGEG
jgi:hypothetical protein